jgi:hypothetical protein
LGLKLVDQFRELMLRFIVKKLTSPSMIVEQSSDALQERYKALSRRIKFNWELLTNSLDNFQSWLSMSERRDQGTSGKYKSKASAKISRRRFSNNSPAAPRRMKQHT